MSVDFEKMETTLNHSIELLKEINNRLQNHGNVISQPEYMDEKQACVYTTLSQSTIKKYQKEMGVFIRDRRKVFKKSNIDAWINQNTIKRMK